MPSRRDVISAALTVCLLGGALVTGGFVFSGSVPSGRPSAAAHQADHPGKRVGRHRVRAGGRAGAAVEAPASPPRALPTAAPSPSPTGPPTPPPGTTGRFGAQILTGTQGVALTFDDGPDPTLTPLVLDVLKEHGVKATFCVIGSRSRDYPDLIRRIAAEGHTLCSHSWQHLLNLGEREWSYQNWDLRSTNDAIHNAVPGAPIRYFRAPGGNFTPGMIELAGSLGMVPLYWDVDPRDWDAAGFGYGQAMVNHVVSVVEGQGRPGSIVLSHDRGHPDTVTAYRVLLPRLKARYQLIPLP